MYSNIKGNSISGSRMSDDMEKLKNNMTEFVKDSYGIRIAGYLFFIERKKPNLYKVSCLTKKDWYKEIVLAEYISFFDSVVRIHEFINGSFFQRKMMKNTCKNANTFLY